MANCGVEIAFAPKELKVAQDLSERLGYWTYQARSRSRPSGLSGGHRSISESDQRRALMMPQELIQMPADRLIVLRAGMSPVRGSKIVYWREKAFTLRVMGPPVVMPHAGMASMTIAVDPSQSPPLQGSGVEKKSSVLDMSDLTLDLVIPALDAAGLEPLPEEGALTITVGVQVNNLTSRSPRKAISRSYLAEAHRLIGPRSQFQSNRRKKITIAAISSITIEAAIFSVRPG